MKKMSKKEKIGIVLMVVAMVFFGLFIWWGTTTYPPEFAVGIIILAGGIFLAGIVTFNKGTENEHKASNETNHVERGTRTSTEKIQQP